MEEADKKKEETATNKKKNEKPALPDKETLLTEKGQTANPEFSLDMMKETRNHKGSSKNSRQDTISQARMECLDRERFYYLFYGAAGHRPQLHLIPETDKELKAVVVAYNEAFTEDVLRAVAQMKLLQNQCVGFRTT